MAQKMQPSAPPLVPVTSFSLQGPTGVPRGKLKVRSEKSKVEKPKDMHFNFYLLPFKF